MAENKAIFVKEHILLSNLHSLLYYKTPWNHYSPSKLLSNKLYGTIFQGYINTKFNSIYQARLPLKFYAAINTQNLSPY